MSNRTQQEVTDRLTAQSLRRMRGLENERTDRIVEYYRQVGQDIQAYIGKAMKETFGAGRSWTYTQMNQYNRAQQLQLEINHRLAQLAQQVHAQVEDGFAEQFQQSSDWSAYILDQATPQNVEIKDPKVPANAVRAMANQEYEGAMFSQRIGVITDAMASDIRDQLAQSMIAGESMDEAAARVEGVIGDASEGYASRALMIARTELMRGSNMGRLSVFEENSAVVDMKNNTWHVAFDDRLCRWCLKRDGLTAAEIVRTTAKDRYFPRRSSAPLHPHCRCTWEPGLKTWKDLIGLDMPEGYGEDVRGFRDPLTGKWSIAPVKSFDEWKAERLALEPA